MNRDETVLWASSVTYGGLVGGDGS